MLGHRVNVCRKLNARRASQRFARGTTNSGYSLAELLSQRTALLDCIRKHESSEQATDWCVMICMS